MDGDSETTSLSPALLAARLPWAFTQHHPLDSGDFIREAKLRGYDLDLPTLQALHRDRLLSPFLIVRSRPVTARSTAEFSGEPRGAGTRLIQLRLARGSGSLIDPAEPPLKGLRFERPQSADYDWWNGLVYSHHQLSMLPFLDRFFRSRKTIRRGGRHIVRLPEALPQFVASLSRYRRMVAAATALEARYLPTLDRDWIRLSGAAPEEWQQYRDGFDPTEMLDHLGIPPALIRDDAENLLFEAHRIDPLGRSWGRLVRYSPPDAWKDLKDAALSAMDLRVTAEILLRFYEDLADRGLAEPLRDLSKAGNPMRGWHPLVERLSFREESLDEELVHLGISPHPRVVLAVEGETERRHIPRLWKALDFPDAPELVRVMKLGGVDRDPVKVGALAAAPLIARRDDSREFWWLIKPPTTFMIAVDPEGRYYGDASRVSDTRGKILAEIRDVISSQDAEVADEDLDVLVEIRTWNESCYEFAHFSDEELAAAIQRVHTTLNGLSLSQVVDALAASRRRRKDIKEVWSRWDYGVSKPALADALWPILKKKLEAVRTEAGAPIPQIVEVLHDAYLAAQRWRYNTFVLRKPPAKPETGVSA